MFMKIKRLFLIALLLGGCILTAQAQSGFHIPGQKKVKDMQKALYQPESFALLIQFVGQDSTLSLAHLDLLDSAYRIAFDRDNPNVYTMLIESYGRGNEALGDARCRAVERYFAQRCHLPFAVRYVLNPIHCSCRGDSAELIRYEVPTSLAVYNVADLPEARRTINGTEKLDNAVLITFRNNPDECLGMARGSFLPGSDSTIRGYYTQLDIPKGAIYSVTNTKDTCPVRLNIAIEEHLDFEQTLERYFLVPHKKQIIVQAGYIVLKSNFNRKPGECVEVLPDSIMVQLPITQEQWDNKLRIFAKKYSEKGVEFKSLSTKKVKSKGSDALHIRVAINATQLDTLYLGKRIQPDELDDYFYEVESAREVGSFTVAGHHYKAFVMNRRGEYDVKEPLRSLFRIVEEEPDDELNLTPQDDEELE